MKRYTVTTWKPSDEEGELVNIEFDSYDAAYNCLITYCTWGGWVGFIFDTLHNRRCAAVGVALD